jgi:hypothetical protein
MIRLFPSGITWRKDGATGDFKVYFQKSNGRNSWSACANCGPQPLHPIGLRQYSVLGQAQGHCGDTAGSRPG